MHYPGVSQAFGSYFLTRFSISTLTQYMSASHGYCSTGRIEYDDRGKYREDKKVRESHIDLANQRAMEMLINQHQCKE